jgi:homoserine kinase type II
VDGPYRALPWQIIHSDFVLANMLFRGGTVSAILDFEFAAPDARAMDLASALTQIVNANDDQAALHGAKAFARSYHRQIDMAAAEVEALPVLMLLRSAVSALWWLGRNLAANPSTPPSLERVERMRRISTWLGAYATELQSAIS